MGCPRAPAPRRAASAPGRPSTTLASTATTSLASAASAIRIGCASQNTCRCAASALGQSAARTGPLLTPGSEPSGGYPRLMGSPSAAAAAMTNSPRSASSGSAKRSMSRCRESRVVPGGEGTTETGSPDSARRAVRAAANASRRSISASSRSSHGSSKAACSSVSRRFQPSSGCSYQPPPRRRPTLHSDQIRSYSSGLWQVTSPPSPAVIALLDWKLNVPASPRPPTGRPR
jgi:hypothetical protein